MKLLGNFWFIMIAVWMLVFMLMLGVLVGQKMGRDEILPELEKCSKRVVKSEQCCQYLEDVFHVKP